ncbi:flavonoid 3'-monooxygenase CYP75B137-like isoform X2 [Amaranthus tricolor]|uniref:flavonoid 3'-monooxygenase CYP75B137-like isoform X2 n=1 Tax=Amaranthus tricolor TaxID=29722 RepID=UPI0025902615|nr:flavonoid 3'-monooxygenase CYP75B137-like isoform X2 [Amaranthus tricolor]
MILEAWLIPILTLFTISCTIFFLTRKQNRLQPPGPPGPKGLPILGNLLSLDPELHTYFTSWAQTYGPIYSLQLGNKLGIVISSATHAREVLKDHDTIFANRDVPAAGRVATYDGLDIVWSPYGATWRLLRKVCVRELLSPATLDAVYGLRRQEIRRMIHGLSEKTDKTVVNIGEEMFLVVMKVVTGMLWGGSVVAEEERENIGSEFRAAVSELTGLLSVPNLSDFFPGLERFDLQGVEKRMKKCAKWLDGIFEKVIEQRLRNGGESKKDFLEVLLQMKDDFEGEGSDKVSFSMTHLKALLMDMVVGGTDTTSNTVELAMAEILNKPEVLKNIQQELDSVVGRDNVVEEHHTFKLPYLLAVMKEALRLHPVLPLLVPHCPSESCIIGGYTIPKGSRVFVNVWAIHRDPSIWSNPLEFDPDRFLNAKFDFSGNDFSYFPFSSGRRICVGIAMAERMVLYSLASLLHSFDWKLPEGEELDLQEKFGIVLSKKTPLLVIPHCRLSSADMYDKIKD